MTEDKPDQRAERLKAALRANLRRRKTQERGRAAPEKPLAERDDGTQGRGEAGRPASFRAQGPDSDKTGL